MDIVQKQLLELGQKVEATNRAVTRLDTMLSRLLGEYSQDTGAYKADPEQPESTYAAQLYSPDLVPFQSAAAMENLLWKSGDPGTIDPAAPTSTQSDNLEQVQTYATAPEPESDPWPELRPDLRTDLNPNLRPDRSSKSSRHPRLDLHPDLHAELRPESRADLRQNLRPDLRQDLRHKDILEDDDHYGESDFSTQDRPLALDIQVQRLTAQLTAAYNRIAALEEQLLSQRIPPSRDD